MSGSTGERAAVVTASARSLPVLDEVVLEDVAAAEAEADRGLLGAVADAALVGLGHQRVERRVDALSSFAVHATDEGDFYPGLPQIVFGPLMAGHIRSSNSRRRYQAYKRIIKNAPRNPVSKTATATKRPKASSSSPIKYKPLEVDPWICGNAL
jgi:hypothetical protein